MSTVLIFNDGSAATFGNTLTLKVDVQGHWLETPSATRFVTGVVSTLAQSELLSLRLEKASTAVPNLSYQLSAPPQGQSQPGGAFLITLPQPSVPQQTVSVTAIPPTPPAPAGVSITIRRQSAPLGLSLGGAPPA